MRKRKLKDDYCTVYAWDVVDIFFATIVASLPALNGIVDQAIKMVMTWGSSSGLTVFSRLRSLGPINQSSRGFDTKVHPRDGFKALSAKGKSSASFEQHSGATQSPFVTESDSVSK